MSQRHKVRAATENSTSTEDDENELNEILANKTTGMRNIRKQTNSTFEKQRKEQLKY